MTMTNDALKYFLKCLPKNAQFQIISYGNDFKYLMRDNKEEDEFTNRLFYTKDEEDIKFAHEQISTFDANFGGTEILNPLKSAYAEENHISYGDIGV